MLEVLERSWKTNHIYEQDLKNDSQWNRMEQNGRVNQIQIYCINWMGKCIYLLRHFVKGPRLYHLEVENDSK
jgi:hypothetical protein